MSVMAKSVEVLNHNSTIAAEQLGYIKEELDRINTSREENLRRFETVEGDVRDIKTATATVKNIRTSVRNWFIAGGAIMTAVLALVELFIQMFH